LEIEWIEAGFQSAGVYGVEGPCWLLHDFDEWWSDDRRRACLLQVAGVLEREPNLMGVSAHHIAAGRKPHTKAGSGLRSPRFKPQMIEDKR